MLRTSSHRGIPTPGASGRRPSTLAGGARGWRARRPLLAAVLLALAAAAALTWPQNGSAQRYVPTQDPEHPLLKYADSLTSLNDRCAVRKAKLNPKVRPVYVNGQPIGFC